MLMWPHEVAGYGCRVEIFNYLILLFYNYTGMAMGGGAYYNHSPPSGGQYGSMSGGVDHVSTTGSYSPPAHSLSPKGSVTSSSINGYNSVSRSGFYYSGSGFRSKCLIYYLLSPPGSYLYR